MIKKISALAAATVLLAVAPAPAQEAPASPQKVLEPAAEVLEPAAEAVESAQEVLEPAAEALESAQEALESVEKTLEPADKTLEQVLASHFETIGGEDAWRAIETIEMDGTMTFPGPQGSMEAPATMWFKTPNMTRMEFVIQGMTGIQAYDGETAWFVMPFMGKPEPEAMPAEMAEQMSEQADINPLLDWKDKGYQVELVGKEEVDGTEAYKLKLTRASGNERYYYLDTDHYLPFKVEGKTTMQGQEIDTSTILSDYKEVGDLVFPHSMEIRQGGPTAPAQVLTINEIRLGVEIPAAKFDMEAEKPATEETSDGDGDGS